MRIHVTNFVFAQSGSTGEPKGVVIEQGAYGYAARVHKTNLHIDHTARVLQFASYGFDTSIEDHLTTFAVGACLCVPSEASRTGGLAEFATQAQANFAHVTPSLAQSLLRRRDFSTIKTLLLGGEPITKANLKEWAEPDVCLIQVYGPSECCVTTTVGPRASPCTSPSNIGIALPGCSTWIARPENPHELCPIGTVGELLVEGPILARGYVGQIDATEKSFVRGLRWAPEKRVYRTGDLVRYGTNGHLHFVGRMDDQIKIRGQRIELGEVESHLLMAPRVQNALAIYPKAGFATGSIIAVLAVQSSTNHFKSNDKLQLQMVDGNWTELITDARLFLEGRLPPYMIPELWLVLENMPTNSAFKSDRSSVKTYIEKMTEGQFKSLIERMSDSNETHEQGSEERPGSETEIMLRKLWSQALNVPESHIHWKSSFYSLGGDSITAMTVASMCRQHHLPVGARDILRHRCIETLVKSLPSSPPYLANHPNAAADSSLSTLLENRVQDESESTAFPLSAIQRLHFQYSEDDGDPFNQQSIFVEAQERLEQESVIAAFNALLHAHPMLRSRFTIINNKDAEVNIQSGWRQRILPMQDIVQGEDFIRLRFHCRTHPDYIVKCASDAKASINISEGPVIAADVFQPQDRAPPYLFISIHHLVVDAVSWRIILRQLEAFLRHGDTHAVQTERTSFREWSLAQLEFIASKTASKHCQKPMASSSERFDVEFWNTTEYQNTLEYIKKSKFTIARPLLNAIVMACQDLECDIVDILATGLLSSFSTVFNRLPRLFLEGHGREKFGDDGTLDPTMTVGWFTTFSPLDIPDQTFDKETWTRCLRLVRHARHRDTSKNFAYFASLMMGNLEQRKRDTRPDHVPMEIVLNHLGTFQQLERPDSLFKRSSDIELDTRLSALKRSKRCKSRRYSLISVMSTIQNDCLSVEVEWNSRMAHQERLWRWISGFEALLSQHFTSGIGINSSKLEEDGLESIGCACAKFGVSAEDIETTYPCSPLQESLLYSQLRDEKPVYNQHFLLQLSEACKQGPSNTNPDTGRLVAAWQCVIAKHPILRTIFMQDDSGKFTQVVLRHVHQDIQVLHLSADEERSVPELWARESTGPAPSPLCGKPLHSIKICTSTSPNFSYCLLSKNHLITDGTSSQILFRDFVAAYDGSLDPDPVPFSTYIQYVCAEDTPDMDQYWANYLDGVKACKLSAWCNPQKIHGSKSLAHDESKLYEFERVHGVLSSKQSITLACQNMDLTASIVFKAAWAWVLAIYNNTEDVVYGALYSGRDIPLPNITQIVGPIASMLPIRAKFTPNVTTPLDLCADIQNAEFDHMARQTMSLARIQHAAKVHANPLFNTILNIQKANDLKAPASSIVEQPSFTADLLYSRDTSEVSNSNVHDVQDKTLIWRPQCI